MGGMLRWSEGQLEAYRKRTPALGSLACAECGAVVQKTGPGQKYCGQCSEKRDLERKKLWARAHPRTVSHETYLSQRSAIAERGQEISDAEKLPISAFQEPNLRWLVRIAVPFTYAASKNHIYTSRATGHVALRKEGRQLRLAISLAVKQALRGRTVVHNKVWIDIFVQKPDHKGDAVNVVDMVCDAIKDALAVDDRWFCLRMVDWQVVKTEPMLHIGIGQEDVVDAQVCSSCGRILALKNFASNRANKRGRNRNCTDCMRSR